MFKTATIWNICQDTHRRYRFTGEAERFACWLREGAAEKLRGSNATCHLYKHLKFFQPFLTSSCIAPQQYANSNMPTAIIANSVIVNANDFWIYLTNYQSIFSPFWCLPKKQALLLLLQRLS